MWNEKNEPYEKAHAGLPLGATFLIIDAALL